MRHARLGIETSCDETGVAVYDTAAGAAARHALYSQIALHAEYGGVVPELASRDHVRKLLPLIRQTLAEAGLGVGDLDGVAYTAGPGLVGALLVGAGVGRARWPGRWTCRPSASTTWKATCWRRCWKTTRRQPPFVALLVSGGHTQLVAVEAIGQLPPARRDPRRRRRRGLRQDRQADGPAVPGRPAAGPLAEAGRPGVFKFSRPMTDRPGLDFSFSGLKTQVLLAWQRPRPDRRDPRRHRPRLRGCGGRHPGDQVRARAGCRPAATRWWWPAASAPTSACARNCSRWRPSAAAASASRARSSAPTTAR